MSQSPRQRDVGYSYLCQPLFRTSPFAPTGDGGVFDIVVVERLAESRRIRNFAIALFEALVFGVKAKSVFPRLGLNKVGSNTPQFFRIQAPRRALRSAPVPQEEPPGRRRLRSPGWPPGRDAEASGAQRRPTKRAVPLSMIAWACDHISPTSNRSSPFRAVEQCGEAGPVVGEDRVDLVTAAIRRRRKSPAVWRITFSCSSTKANFDVRSIATSR